MSELNITWNPFAGRQKRKDQLYERQQKSADARIALEDRGLHPDEAQKITDEWVRTGIWNIPTERNTGEFQKMEPGPDGRLAYGPPAPVTEPVSLRKQEEVEMPYVIGEDGRMVKPNVDEDFISGLSKQGFRVKPKFQVKDTEKNGQDIYVDAKTGAEIRREPNHSKKNSVIKVGSAGGGENDPLAVLHRGILNRYFSFKPDKNGKLNIPDDLTAQAVESAKFFGLPTHEIETKNDAPGFMATVGRFLGGVTPGEQNWGKETGKVEVPGPAMNTKGKVAPKGKIRILTSDGQDLYILAAKLDAAKRRDPGLQVFQ